MFWAALLIVGPLAYGQDAPRLRGTVTDSLTPLPAASIVVLPDRVNASTDLNGQFTVQLLRTGQKQVSVSYWDIGPINWIYLDQPQLSVEWLGDQIGMSCVHLFRKIKALTGLSPSDYIRNYKIKYANQRNCVSA